MRFTVLKAGLLLGGAFAISTGCGSDADTVPSGGANCGNSRLDPDEDCDGTLMGTGTCGSATLGAKTQGTLSCTNCLYNTSACTSSAGGNTGSGGSGGP